MQDEIKALIAIAGGVLIGLILWGSFVVVDPGCRGVRVTLGSVSHDALGEGVHLKMPVISSVVQVPVKQITKQTQAVCFSSDLQTITLALSVLYRIPDSKVVDLFQQYNGDPYDTLVEPRIQEAVKKEVSLYAAEDIVKKRDKIKSIVLPNVKSTVEGLLIITDVIITNVDLTDAMEKSIENKQIKQQEALAKVYELQKAEKEAEIAIAAAKGEAEAIRLKSEALQKAPEVIHLEIIKKWDGKAPHYLSTNGGGANIVLPLQK